MNTLERTQYQAALAVSGAWKGTSRNKIYDELGWETLDERRIFRRLTQFYKIMTGLTPELRHCMATCLGTVTQMSLILYPVEMIDMRTASSLIV